MALTVEWKRRVDRWRAEHPQHFYSPVGELELEGFITREQLLPEQAAIRAFAPMPEGTAWGAKWEYAWFRCELVAPEEVAGERLVLALRPGGESAIFVNGVAAGALDREHTEITLAREAAPGARYQILAETYAGHGPRVSGGGPVGYGRESVPEPPDRQAVVGKHLRVWNEEVYQLYIEVETLYDIREHLDINSLRVDDDQALVTIPSSTLSCPRGDAGHVRAARQRWRRCWPRSMARRRPRCMPLGIHTSTGLALAAGGDERKRVRTFGTQLALMDEYRVPLSAEPAAPLLDGQDQYPALYERVKQAVAKGQWVPEGGMWVEADTNISGGEALVRQFLYGKRFFQEEFGVDCELLWLPDVFGYSGNMPQIMRGCGIPYFATAKIFGAYHGGQPFPYNTSPGRGSTVRQCWCTCVTTITRAPTPGR